MAATNMLNDLLASFNALPPEQKQAVEANARKIIGERAWIPNPGPQLEAVMTEADELFYGGQAGGGKTDLLCGLALTDHKNSLLLRRTNADTLGLEDRTAEILGSRDGLNSQKHIFRLPGRVIEIGGCQYENDKQSYKGRPHDLKGFDEIADFSESQYRFIIAWNRSAVPGQRCRVVCTGNPPTTPEGLWVLKYWGPWLDPTHPNPAKEGELRWFTTIDGQDVECDGPELVEVAGEMIQPRSRTFIRSKLSDNPDLAATNYDSVLAALPSEYRDAYRDGRFDVVQKDRPFQVIPTEWIQRAMDRWDPDGGRDIPMSCLSNDPSEGGDGITAAPRHGLWFAEVQKMPVPRGGGKVDPLDIAIWLLMLRDADAEVVIDMGGGYGGGVFSHLKAKVPSLLTSVPKKLIGHNGANSPTRTSRDNRYRFVNMRAQVHWLFREALEPGLGQAIQLPPDPELLADLAATTYKLTSRGVLIEEKTLVKARIGRSPDKGDAVINAWNYGEQAVMTNLRLAMVRQQMAAGGGGPKVNLGYAHMKRRRGRR